MQKLKIADVKGLQDVHVYQLCECDAVAAYTLDEAIEWYKQRTGLTDDDLYNYDDIELIPLEHKVYEGEESDKRISIKEIIDRYWDNKPFIVFTTAL